MEHVRHLRRSAWFCFAVVCLPLVAAAMDGRLAGYWTSVPEETEQAAITFSILGKWAIVNQHWAAAPADVKVRYTVVTSGDGGTLNAAEPLDKLPAAPRTIRYELQNGELLLVFPDTTHTGRYRFVKSTPPAASSRPTGTVDFSKPGLTPVQVGPDSPPAQPAKQGFNLLGGWTTEAGVEKQLTLFIAKSRTAAAKINQQWTRGSDNPLVSKNSDYAITFANGRGTLAQVKPDYEGSAIPPLLNFAVEGDTLVITVDAGDYAGQYRLLRMDPHAKEPPPPRQE